MRSRFVFFLSPALLPAWACNSCFVAGTRIETPDGAAPIEALKVGDVVFSFSLEQGFRIRRRIRAVLRSRAREVRKIVGGGKVIAGVTTEHPFFDPIRREYRPVRSLRVGDALASFDETDLRTCPIESITATELAAPDIDVFNLTIDGPEANYFAEGILVHNKEPATPSCPADTVTISPHAAGSDAAAPAETQADFDVTLKVVPDPDLFSVFIVRGPSDVQPPPQSIEMTSDKTYRARLLDPAPGDYELDALGFLTVDGTSCSVPETIRKFTVAKAGPDGSAGDGGSD
jgi:hypothetical protein